MEFIYTIRNNLSSETCKEIIEKFESDPDKGPGKVGAGVVRPEVKTSTDLHMTNKPAWEEVDKMLFEKLKDGFEKYRDYLMNNIIEQAVLPEDMPVFDNLLFNLLQRDHHDDGYQIQRIEKGQYYVWHSDMSNSRGRVVAFIWYLNTIDTHEGGSTDFLGKRIQPREGDLIFFPATWTYFHTGRPVVGDKAKYIITGFISENVPS